MPLNQQRLAALRNQCQQHPGTIAHVDLAANWNLNADQCACWRWASSGLALGINEDPAQMFSAISDAFPLNAGSAWANNAAAL